ncbi:MAG: DUF2442 domain-containing protein [Deltaproteobacteria bacterium]|nr:DUF2442 domain-containing protein [Deltaproteobacteria bacterium]
MRHRCPSNPCAEVAVTPHVVEVQVVEQGLLHVRFADGTAGDVVMSPSHMTGVFEKLRDPSAFAQACVVDGFVTWPGELDLAPDAMYAAIAAEGCWRLG